VSKPRLLQQLGLKGLIHIWGDAGTGKTLLACMITSDESRFSKVEWINTDAKQSFVSQLKRSIESRGGEIQNIAVTLTSSRQEVRNLILNLVETIESDVSLVVIDSVTRLLDMAREDPILWGRELVEEALPSLAGIVNQKGLNVIVTSESRVVDDSRTLAVYHKTIAKWADFDVRLVKNGVGDSSEIILGLEEEKPIGILQLHESSVVFSQLDQKQEQVEV